MERNKILGVQVFEGKLSSDSERLNLPGSSKTSSFQRCSGGLEGAHKLCRFIAEQLSVVGRSESEDDCNNDLDGDWLVLGLVVPSFGLRCSCIKITIRSMS